VKPTAQNPGRLFLVGEHERFGAHRNPYLKRCLFLLHLLIKGLAQAKGKIDELQGQIDIIIHNLKVAGEVIEAIKTASTAAATALAQLQG